MAVTEMELNEALNRAASLMSPQGQQAINYASKMNAGKFDNDGGYIQPHGSHGIGKTKPMNYTQPLNSNRSSNLPKVIQESIMRNPLNVYSNEYSSEGSVLDTINYKPATPPRQQVLQEEYMYEHPTAPLQPQPQYYQQQPTLGVDYNYIRTIVNECIQANMERIKEEILKESSLKTLRLGAENKIQLIDNKNNLYESKLEFKRNISKK